MGGEDSFFVSFFGGFIDAFKHHYLLIICLVKDFNGTTSSTNAENKNGRFCFIVLKASRGT